MKKKLGMASFLILIVSTTMVFANASGEFETASNTIMIGHNAVELQYPTYIKDGRIYVSLRGFCDNLGIPIDWNSANGEIKVDISKKKVTISNKTLLKEDSVIPDEETAIVVGRAILEKHVGKVMEYETEDKIFYLRAVFLEDENAWLVVQNFRFKKLNAGGSTDYSDFINIKLNKNTGEVMYINTYSTFS